MMNKQIAKLEAEVEALLTSTIGAYQKFIFLCPMLENQKLHGRINKERNAYGFERLRLWLYWSLVQQLSNICSDTDSRSPSIATVTEKLKKDQLRKQLEEKCVKNNRLFGEAEIRADFNRAYSDYVRRAEEMLSSRAVGGYKKIRNKLVSHHDRHFDVKNANVKIGDERKLLETLQVLVGHLLIIVRNTDHSWDSILRGEEKIARDFWGT
jgi:hypothetical protein